jgi:predicted DNA-binding protein with PD1-like motif
MRAVKHPGIASNDRVQWTETRSRLIRVELRKGLSLLESVKRGFLAEGCHGGCLRFGGTALGPFGYLMPALPEDDGHVAYYSEMFRPSGITRMIAGSLTFGVRNDAHYFHAHGHWLEADGKHGGGHLAPEETFIAETVTVDAFALQGITFTTRFDEETRFPLLSPGGGSDVPFARTSETAFAIRLKPNIDISIALEDFCRAHGVARARIQGGVGSLIGARFVDGRIVEPFITEVAINEGFVVPDGQGDDRTRIDTVMVDHTGAISEGRLVHGQNPVLITFEIGLEVLRFS